MSEALINKYQTSGITVVDFWMGIKRATSVFVPCFFISIIIHPTFLLPLTLFLTLVSYNVNKKFTIEEGHVIFPASDVENSIIDMLILKPVWGIFYNKSIPFESIVEVKKDGFGSKEREFPLTIIDTSYSNSLIFSSRQKRDEFHTKLSTIMKTKTNDYADFGE
jgi:hypothetical protein